MEDPFSSCFSEDKLRFKKRRRKRKEEESYTEKLRQMMEKAKLALADIKSECCPCPGIPPDLLRTRVWSSKIKARENKVRVTNSLVGRNFKQS